MVQIIYYRSKCIGCNACVEAAPDRWRISRKDGKSVLIDGKEKKGIFRVIVSQDEQQPNEMAAANCPARVIRVEAT